MCCCKWWVVLCRAKVGVAGEVGQKPDIKSRGSNIKPSGKPAREQWFPRIWPEEKQVRQKRRAQDARALRRVQEEAEEEILLLDIDVEFDKLQVNVASIVNDELVAFTEVQVSVPHLLLEIQVRSLFITFQLEQEGCHCLT